jgi:hypothetical protein
MKIREVILQQGGGQTLKKLMGVSEGQLIENQKGTTGEGGVPAMYAWLGTNQMLIHPTPSSGDVFKIYYVPVPPTLATATATYTETTPSMIPVQFHWDVLLPGMVVEMLDKDQRSKDVQFWNQRFMDGMLRLKEWSASFMGDANPSWVSGSGNSFYWDDQRSRR